MDSVSKALRRFNRVLKVGSNLVRGFRYAGYCPLCESRTLFFQMGEWLREDLRCFRCDSSARHRAVAHYLQTSNSVLSDCAVYEAAPSGSLKDWLAKKCADYQCSQYRPEQPMGCIIEGMRNENLERLSFSDDCFDLVITQDVFEHIQQPVTAFAEVARVLKPNGSHVFTIPYYPEQRTETRVNIVQGEPVSDYVLEYHENPVDELGSLVFTRFGSDLCDIILKASGMSTTIHVMHEKRFGIEGECLLIFHSRKH